MMATTIIQPIDMVKVRIQLGAEGSPMKVASDIIAKDGMDPIILSFPEFVLACRTPDTGAERTSAGWPYEACSCAQYNRRLSFSVA